MHRIAAGGLALLAGVFASAGVAWAQPQPQDPANFTQSTYATGLGQVTDLAWATNGSNVLFVAQRNGVIRVIRNNALQGDTFHTLSVNDGPSECGLIGLCVDPNYGSNGRIWVFATVNTTTQRMFRYTATTQPDGDIVASGAPTQVGPDLPCANANHDGGSILFGSDGNLYFGVGNNGNGTNRGGWGAGDELTSLGSKIGRMTTAGNPVPGGTWNDGDAVNEPRDYFFSRGWRNPFGMAWQPGTNALWVLEVGDDWEHIFVATEGSNRGWLNGNTVEYENDASLLDPRFRYQRGTGGWTNGAGCITRGCFYTGSTFPSQYQGNLFFAEYNGVGKIIHADVNGTNTFAMGNTELFVTNASGVVDVETGPDGALYYNGGGTIYRLQYTGGGSQAILVSPGSLNAAEGGAQATFTVTLAADPGPSGRAVTVSRTGDSDIVIDAATTTLNFTSANWSTGLPARVSAQEDADATNGSATITLASNGLSSVNATVTEQDNDTAAGAPTATITRPVNGEVVSGTNAEFYGDGTDPQGSGTLDRAEFRIDGKLVDTDTTPGGHYHINGGHNLWNTKGLSNGPHTLEMTVFDAGGLSGSHQITVTVANNVAAFQQDPGPDGLVVMEAENASRNTGQGGHTWSPTTAFAGYSGSSARRAMADGGTNHGGPGGYSGVSPRLDFAVNFDRTGTHYVWIRGWAPSGLGDDDSCHVGLDDVETASSDRITGFGQAWTWSASTMDGAAATIDVTTPGIHTVNVWMREDGFVLDKVLITSNAAFAAPVGTGPAQSPRTGGRTGGGGGGGGGGCGATGLEALLAVALAAALGRRK